MRFNPLPIIALWLESFSHDHESPSRADLRRWLNERTLNGRTLSPMDAYVKPGVPIELVIDCLIAAGIGREANQLGTVYCSASYGE